MKANGAPEKIYLIRNIPTSTSLNTTNDNHDEFLQEWYKGREKDTDIEYIRTDAFIERAAEYLSYHLDTSKIDVNYKFDFIEDFKKAMKL